MTSLIARSNRRISWILSTILFLSCGMGAGVMILGINTAYNRGYSQGYSEGYLVGEMGGEEAVKAWGDVARRCTPILESGEACTIPFTPELYPELEAAE